VAIGAYGNLGIASHPTLTMHAGVVLRQLICPQTRVELADVCWIGMATSTQLWNLLAFNLSFPTRLAAHGFVRIIAGWITTVTTGAGQTPLGVDVLAEFLLRDS
jgi:hypothetical protein